MRDDGLDRLRVGATLLGIIFHASLAYSPIAHSVFPSADRQNSIWVDLVIWFLHLFRMPLFFMLAGYFCAQLIRKRRMGGMLRNRAQRIGLVFLCLWPLMGSLLSAATLRAADSVQHPSPALRWISEQVVEKSREQRAGDSASAIDLPFWLLSTGHLWFLYYLLLFYVLTWSATRLDLPALLKPMAKWKPRWLAVIIGLPLTCAITAALASVSAPHPAPEGLLPQFWAVIYYGSFFLLGHGVFHAPEVLDPIRPRIGLLCASAFCGYAGYFWLIHSQTGLAQELVPLRQTSHWMAAALGAWISVAITLMAWLAANHRFICKLLPGGRGLRFCADACYWSYLLHLPFLLLLQYQLIDWSAPWGIKLALTLSCTIGFCLLSYALVRRIARFPLFS